MDLPLAKGLGVTGAIAVATEVEGEDIGASKSWSIRRKPSTWPRFLPCPWQKMTLPRACSCRHEPAA